VTGGKLSDTRLSDSPDFVLSCPVPLPPGERLLLGYGSGGVLTHRLITGLFAPVFGDPELSRLGDAAVLELPGGDRLAFTTDAFVVQPAFFPGSNIGALSVNGTVNDLAMMGAVPLALSVAMILEEGLEFSVLGTVAASMADASDAAGVRVVTGDTKVVERGGADGLYVTTSGIGLVPEGVDVGPDRARPGDRVIVTGPIGSHGVAVMSRRGGIDFDAEVVSDSAPLTELAQAMLRPGGLRAMRDATRGGVASVLNEIAEASGVRITVEEAAFPVLPPVKAACEMLGLDPMYVANEGVAVAIVADQNADAVLSAARAVGTGAHAAVVGEVLPAEGSGPLVSVRTGLGASRPLIMLTGDQLPRIC
jgi:hydrogenase expression/formation protein HypE